MISRAGNRQFACPVTLWAEFSACSQSDTGRKQWKLLSLEDKTSPRLEFVEADNLRAALSNKTVRRRLVRCLRDHFNWPGAERICFYNDFLPCSFFFQEFRPGRPGICGGLILPDHQDLSRAYYSIHT